MQVSTGEFYYPGLIMQEELTAQRTASIAWIPPNIRNTVRISFYIKSHPKERATIPKFQECGGWWKVLLLTGYYRRKWMWTQSAMSCHMPLNKGTSILAP